MVCFKGFWHGKWSCAAAAAFALLTLACGGSKDSSTITVSGKVTYTRRALTLDANGVPTGLSESYGSAQGARGVRVRAIEVVQQKLSDGSTGTAYITPGYTYTDEYGDYSLSVPKDTPCFIEVQSIAGTGSTKAVRILSDTGTDLSDISSGTPAADCTLYALRKALNGSSSTSNPVLATQSSGNVTVNFAVDSSTQWWIAPASVPTTATATSPSLEGTGTGSRILGIIDSIYTFTDIYGDPTPGAALDLFYRPAMADDSRGSFVDYTQYETTGRYYGALRANANDDAWDEAILFMMCARNALYSHTTVSPYTPPSDQLPLDTTGLARKTGLNQVHALFDGLPYGMAASLLQSPYLADTHGTALVAYRDIRDVSGLDCDAFSAPGIAALSWDLLIRANTNPYGGKLTSDTYSEWSKIDSEGLRRFFTLTIPGDSSSRPTDTASVYNQLLRLQEDPSSSDTIDLNNIFTDSTLTDMVSPYGLAWPRPAIPASYLLDWGTDPDTDASPIPSFQMDMASAQADASGAYPNLSKGEIVRAKFLLTKDVLYTFKVTPSSALPTGATIEVKVIDASGQYRTFEVSGSGGTLTDSLMLDGDSTTAKYIPLNFRLKTDSTITAPISPVTVTVSLVPRAS